MRPMVSIRKALADPNLLGTTITGDSWSSWRTLLIAAMGEKLNDSRTRGIAQLDWAPARAKEAHSSICSGGRS